MVTPDRCTEEARGRVRAEMLFDLCKQIDRRLLATDWSEPYAWCFIPLPAELLHDGRAYVKGLYEPEWKVRPRGIHGVEISLPEKVTPAA